MRSLTDPSFSGGIHWTLDEQDESVIVCDGCDHVHLATGTTFRLPWAKRQTKLRVALGAEPVSAADRRRLLRQSLDQVPHAMLFLRKLETIEIWDGAKKRARFNRAIDDGTIRIRGPAGEEEWLLLRGNFEDEAKALRRRHPALGERQAEVQIALRPNFPVAGRLYATLPTKISTGLPLHLDASFFPAMDRKGILLDAGYEAEWNRAAIGSAAQLLSSSVENVAHALGPKSFWTLVADARKLDRRKRGEGRTLAAFWARLVEVLPSASVMWTRHGAWAQVGETVATPRDGVLAGLLEDLGVPTIAPLVAPLVPDRALGIQRISLGRLVETLQTLGLTDGATADELPEPLRAARRRAALKRELGGLVQPVEALDLEIRSALRTLALWEGIDGHFSSFDSNWLVPRDAVEPFSRFSPHAFVVWSGRDAALKALGHVGDRYSPGQALDHLEAATDDELAALSPREVRPILAWFKARLSKLEDPEVERVGKLRLIPTEDGLRSADETVQTGGFKDPLRLTSILDRKLTRGLEPLIARMGVRKLGFADYLLEHVAKLDSGRDVSIRALVELIAQCARRRETIDRNPELLTTLRELDWIPHKDGTRGPPGEAYFDSKLVRDVLGTSAPLVHSRIRPRTAAGDLLRLLGVTDVPRPADVLVRVEEIVTAEPDQQQSAQILEILGYLTEHMRELDADFSPLRRLDWLPAEQEGEWWAPGGLSHIQQEPLRHDRPLHCIAPNGSGAASDNADGPGCTFGAIGGACR